MTTGRSVSVVVPVHNGRDLLAECLASVPARAELIVIDDLSTDGAPEMVAERFPAARVIRNPENLGFGATANRGLAAAHGDVRIVLNSDARLRVGALDRLVSAFDDPAVGIAGPRLVFPDGSHQTAAAAFPRPATVFTGAFLLNSAFRRLFPGRRFRFELGLDERDHRADRDVDWLIGVCLAFRADALPDLDGGFDEGYFMYGEETDLCWRAWHRGWKVRYVADAVVVHVGRGSTGDPRVAARRSMRSEARFMHRAYGRRSLSRWRAARIAGTLVKLPLLAAPAVVDRRVRERLVWQAAALRAAAGRDWRRGLPVDIPASVLFVQITADRYGSDRALLDLVSGLTGRGWRVEVLVPYPGPLVEDLGRVGARVVVGPVGAPRRVFRTLGWVRYFLHDLPLSVLTVARMGRRADLVHVNTALMVGGALGARLSGRPFVWHIRESFRDAPRWWPAYGRLMRLADVVVANSPAIMAEAEAVGLGSRLRLVWEGLDFSRLPEPPAPVATPGVVTVGRINDVKGHDVLVDALGLLRAEGLQVPATIAGDVFPGGEAHLRRLVERIRAHGLEDQVALPGFVDDVPALLSGFGVFVFPSVRPESFGYALVEAMALGLACVATDHGGPRDIIRHGETGLLVPPGNPEALAAAIRLLHEDPALRERLGRRAARDVRERFSADSMVGQMLAVYGELLGRPGPGGPPVRAPVSGRRRPG